LTVSLESLVIDHEICGILHRMLAGITVTDATLGIDVMEKVGPGGHFLNQRHTLTHFQKEHFTPALCDRASHEAWVENGCRGMQHRAKEAVSKILKEHEPTPLDAAVDKELLRVVKEVGEREGV